MVLEKLGEVLTSNYKGPKAGFTQAHVLKAVLVLGHLKSVGRYRLGLILDLGQGEVRTLIRRLKETGLVVIQTSGCSLTKVGQKEYLKINRLLPWSFAVNGRSLGMGESCWVVDVRGRSDRIKKGIEQRDAAVKAGAKGALTAVFSSGRFRVPPDNTDTEQLQPSELWATVRSSEVLEGDVLIICGADEQLSAEYGALSAALTIL